MKAVTMQYISTRGTAPVLGFGEAMLTGLARDGGLYVPESVPALSESEIAALAGLSYEEVAFRIMRPFVGETFGDDEFRGLIAAAYEASAMPPARRWCNSARTTSCSSCSTGPRSPSRTSPCS